MIAHVKLHAGWSINRIAPGLFKDKPIVNALLADDLSDSPGHPFLLIDNKPYRPVDQPPASLASEDIVTMNDALLRYDVTNPVARRLVAEWFREKCGK
jgi:hypothetical protein